MLMTENIRLDYAGQGSENKIERVGGGCYSGDRYDFIDYAKCIGIMVICLGHFLPAGNVLKVILYSFHVPVFFWGVFQILCKL
jgi:hypothetical protein